MFFYTDCNCPRNQTSTEICNRFTGECFCEENFQGDNCEQCNLGYFGYPECKGRCYFKEWHDNPRISVFYHVRRNKGVSEL